MVFTGCIPSVFKNAVFRSHFRSCIKTHHKTSSKPITGIDFERILAGSMNAHSRTLKSIPYVFWDPRSNTSGVDIEYRDIGYSCKGSRFTSISNNILHIQSYKLNRCPTDDDTILEIDRSHRHNYDYYAILARRHFQSVPVMNFLVDNDTYFDRIKYSLYVFPSWLTKSDSFTWDLNQLITDEKKGIQLYIKKRKMTEYKINRQLHIKWNLTNYKECLSIQVSIPKEII